MCNEAKRYKEFQQLRSDIRGSDRHLIVGIDIAKDKHHAFFGTARGVTLLKRLIFTNDLEGFQKLIEHSQRIKKLNGLANVVFGLEPTGNYHKALGHWLIEHGYSLVLVAGKAVKDNRQLLDGRWDKNDTKDSANVADLISQGKCLFYEYPDQNIHELRDLLSLRKQLKKQEHSLRMRIRNGLIAKYFPEMDRYWGSCLEENLAIVKWCLDPFKIVQMPFSDFIKMVTSTDRGERQIRRLRSIYDAAASSIGLPMTPSAEFEAQMLVDRLKSVKDRIDLTMKNIHIVCKLIPAYKYLLTIPGFGPVISAMVIAVIGVPYRFKHGKQVIRTAGLDLNANRSGKKSDAAVPVISKKGDAQLRWALYQAGLVATSHNTIFSKMLYRMIEGREAERGIKTKMRVKIASKMLIIAWTIMKKQEPFNEQLVTAQ